MKAKNQAKIKELLEKGVENVYPNKKFLEDKLNSQEKLTLYLGIDPTGKDLHIGHAIPLMKLKIFQDLGHKVILLIGNFTALCGDPDKSHTRARLTTDEINNNLRNYKTQIAKILNTSGENPVEFKFNYDWLSKLSLNEFIEIASHFTVQQMLARDLFAKRIKNENPIAMHEFFYPLMQAYDSVAMNVDGELGGNDQTFNMLAGRDLMKSMQHKEKFVLTTKLLADTTGKKMGKTEGNMITLTDNPQNMFGKIMSWTDDMILLGFELCTYLSLDEINKIKQELKNPSNNPRDIKINLAKTIVSIFHSNKDAVQAEKEFNNIFRDKNNPNKMDKLFILNIEYNIVDLIMLAQLAHSKTEAKRLIEQGGVSVNNKKITDWKTNIKPQDQDVLKVGKRKFAQLNYKK